MYAVNGGGNFYESLDRGETWTQTSTLPTVPLTTFANTLAIRPDSTNIMYAGMFGYNSIYKSTDYGASWKPVNTHFKMDIESIVINPADPQIAYATSDGSSGPNVNGIWKTTNGGESWFLWALQHVSFYKLAIDQARPDTMYAGTGAEDTAGFYETTNAGATWKFFGRNFYPQYSIWDIKIDPHQPNNVYLASQYSGVFTFRDAKMPA